MEALALVVEHAGDAEIDELRRDAARPPREEDVVGLHVAVHDAALVGVGEGVHHGHEHAQRLHGGERSAVVDALLEVFALQVLLDDEERVAVLDEVEHPDDVGVLDARGGAGLLREASRDALARGVLGQQHLERHLARGVDVDALVHRAHAAGADVPQHPVLASPEEAPASG